MDVKQGPPKDRKTIGRLPWVERQPAWWELSYLLSSEFLKNVKNSVGCYFNDLMFGCNCLYSNAHGINSQKMYAYRAKKASREMSWQGLGDPSSPGTGKNPHLALDCVRVGNKAESWMGGGRTSDLREMCLRNQNFTVTRIPTGSSGPVTSFSSCQQRAGTMAGRDSGRVAGVGNRI